LIWQGADYENREVRPIIIWNELMSYNKCGKLGKGRGGLIKLMI
jgi:hypothetical protein